MIPARIAFKLAYHDANELLNLQKHKTNLQKNPEIA